MGNFLSGAHARLIFNGSTTGAADLITYDTPSLNGQVALFFTGGRP